jgi:pyridoxine 5-phosphate synthase
MPSLTIRVDHVAGIRRLMASRNPDPAAAAIIAQMAGADGIAVQLQEDQYAVHESDVRLLRQIVNSKLILHIAPTSVMTGLVLDIKPERVILEPEPKEEAATDNGIDLILHGKEISETVDAIQSNGISLGICIPAEPEQAKLAHQIRADWVQIHAGRLKAAASSETQRRELDRIIDTVKMARKLRLHISIGHGIDDQLIKLFKGIEEIDEICLGQSLIAKAVLLGMQEAVGSSIDLIRTL